MPDSLTDTEIRDLRDLLTAVRNDRWAGKPMFLNGIPVVPSYDALPTADAFHAFAFMGIRGTPDVVYCCLRDAGGAYAWEIVATG